MARAYSEIDDIRHDLDSLKHNVVELTRHLKEDGNAHAKEWRKTAAQRLSHLREASKHRMDDLEKGVKAHPGRSLAFAFLTGLAASYLMRRR